MRRLHASGGFRHSCAEGAAFSCRLHRIIPTKSIVRVELEQKTYTDSNTFHVLDTDCPERILGLQSMLEGAPPLPERKLLWHCAFEKLLDGTRDGSNPILTDEIGDK